MTPDPLAPREKYFTRKWRITAPSHPTVVIFRATPEHTDVWLPLVTSPSNNEFQDTASKVWDEAAIQEWRDRRTGRYEEAKSTFAPLEILIELAGAVIGYGGIFMVKPGVGTIGIVLNKEARGKGIAKLAVSVMAQLCLEFGLEPVAGTMKANAPMRATFKSLGFEEREAVHSIPGRGIVAELGYKLKRGDWKDIEMNVVFGEPVV